MQGVIAAGDIVERDFDRPIRRETPIWGSTCRFARSPGIPFLAACCSPSIHKTIWIPIQTWPVPSRSGEVLLVRRDGSPCSSSRGPAAGGDARLRLRVPLNRSDVAAVMAVQGRQGNVEAVDYRGVPVFAALRPVPDTAWFLIAKIDSEEVGEPIRRRSILLGVTAVSADSSGGSTGAVSLAARAAQPVPRAQRVRNRAPGPAGTVQLSEPLCQ